MLEWRLFRQSKEILQKDGNCSLKNISFIIGNKRGQLIKL